MANNVESTDASRIRHWLKPKVNYGDGITLFFVEAQNLSLGEMPLMVLP